MFIESLFVKPKGIVEGDGRIEFLARLRNTAKKDYDGILRVDLGDREGPLGEIRGACLIPSQSESEVLLEFRDTSGLKLWPLEDPDLYRADAVLERHGVQTDSFTVRFGYREARFTPEGFHLNGSGFTFGASIAIRRSRGWGLRHARAGAAARAAIPQE